MKKIALVFVSIISLGLATVSCSKSDSETSIEGKWIISQEGAIVNGQEVLVPHMHATGCEKDYTLFSAGGVAKDYDFSQIGGNCSERITSYTYSRNGSDLTVTFSDVSDTGKILNLTDTELKISNTDDEGTSVAVFTKG